MVKKNHHHLIQGPVRCLPLPPRLVQLDGDRAPTRMSAIVIKIPLSSWYRGAATWSRASNDPEISLLPSFPPSYPSLLPFLPSSKIAICQTLPSTCLQSFLTSLSFLIPSLLLYRLSKLWKKTISPLHPTPHHWTYPGLEHSLDCDWTRTGSLK